MSELRIEVKSSEEGWHEQRLLLDEKYVSGLSVVDLTMRIGVASVRMGGIAGVETEREHRHKGYSRRVLEHTTQWMTENGFDCATLFGIQNYYHKFGYAVCFVTNRFDVSARFAARAEKRLTVRPFTPDDLPAVRDLYAANSHDLTGSIVRNERTRWFKKGSDYEVGADAVVFTNATGAVVAYAARDRTDPDDFWLERIVVTEVGLREPQHGADIVAWAAEAAATLRVGQIRFLLPPQHPFGETLAEFGAEQTVTYPRLGEGMGRLLRQSDFFAKTLPEWTRRAAHAPGLPAASLRFETELGGDTLHWTGAALTHDAETQADTVVRLPQSRLMQLVMGYHSADALRSLPDVQTDGDPTLLRILFPRRLAYMWEGDHF